MYYISLLLEKSEKSREQWKPAHFEKKKTKTNGQPW